MALGMAALHVVTSGSRLRVMAGGGGDEDDDESEAYWRRVKVSQFEERLRCPYWQNPELVFARKSARR